jgi:hypothetical protein
MVTLSYTVVVQQHLHMMARQRLLTTIQTPELDNWY